MHCVTPCMLVIVVLVSCVHGQTMMSSTPPAVTACCALKLMDAGRQVAIEMNGTLPTGTFHAARLRVCASDRLVLQLWTRLTDNTVQLKWQSSLTPTATQTRQAYAIMSFDANNLPTVTSSDRLGLFGVSASSLSVQKLDVPYDVDRLRGSVRYSTTRYNDTTLFTPGLTTTVEDFTWPRSFLPYITFCSSADCSDLAADVPPVSTTTPATTKKSLPYCGCPTSCRPDTILSESISAQDTNIKSLEDQINKMSDLIDSLQSSTVQTGYCPDQFTPGVYGLGSCYIIYRERVQLGEAAIRCTIDHAANLVDIDSDIENQFIYNIVTANGTRNNGVERFWTAGMYSQKSLTWMWYTQNGTPRTSITATSYRAWRDNVEPRPTSDLDTCLVSSVDVTNDVIYWEKSSCIEQRYFICELPKVCY